VAGRFFSPSLKSRLILAKLHGRPAAPKSEILRAQVVKETFEPIIAQRSEVVRSGSRPSKPFLTVEFERLRETAWKPRRPRLRIA